MPPTNTDEIDTEVADETEVDTAAPADDLPVESEGMDAQPSNETETDAAPEAPAIDLTEYAKKHGLDDVPATPDELFSHLKAERERQRQNEQLMQFYQRDAAELQRMRAEQARQQQAQQAQQAEQQRKKWEAPKRDPRWSQIIAIDPDTNQPVIHEKFRGLVNPSVLDDYTKYQEFRKNAYDKLVEDPSGFYEETGLYDSVQERIDKIVEQRLAEHEHRSALSEFREQHSWAIARDHMGNEVLSDLGQVFDGLLAQTRALNPQATTRQAIKDTWGQFAKWAAINRPDLMQDTPAAEAPEPKKPAQVRDEKNGQFLKKAAAKTPNRGPAKADDDARSVVDFRKRALQRAEEAGVPADSWGKVPE